MNKESRFKERPGSRFQRPPEDPTAGIEPVQEGPLDDVVGDLDEVTTEFEVVPETAEVPQAAWDARGTNSLPEGYEGMASADQSGRPVWLTDGERTVEATWRRTRYHDKETRQWTPTEFWSIRNSGGQRVPFEPTGWRRAS